MIILILLFSLLYCEHKKLTLNLTCTFSKNNLLTFHNQFILPNKLNYKTFKLYPELPPPLLISTKLEIRTFLDYDDLLEFHSINFYQPNLLHTQTSNIIPIISLPLNPNQPFTIQITFLVFEIKFNQQWHN